MAAMFGSTTQRVVATSSGEGVLRIVRGHSDTEGRGPDGFIGGSWSKPQIGRRTLAAHPDPVHLDSTGLCEQQGKGR